MNSETWKKLNIDHAQMGRTIRDEVARTYLIPSFHEEAIIWSGIAVRAADLGTVKVTAVHSSGTLNQSLAYPITEVDALDVFTLEALARTKREVDKWYCGERDTLPTAEELGLIDPEDYNGPAYVIGQASDVSPTPREPRPYKVHEVGDLEKVTLPKPTLSKLER